MTDPRAIEAAALLLRVAPEEAAALGDELVQYMEDHINLVRVGNMLRRWETGDR